MTISRLCWLWTRSKGGAKYKLCDRSIKLLDRMLHKISRPWLGHQYMDSSAYRHRFIYHHANNILTLACDILFLNQNNRISSTFVLIRPMFESMFNLVAAVKNPSFAMEKMISEPEHQKDRMERWIKYSGDSDGKMAESVSLLTNIIRELRQCFSIKSQRKWNTLEVAREAKQDYHYLSDYFMFSANIHANIGGIMAQENQCGSQRILQITIYILLATVGHIVQILEIANPQSYIDESTKLLNELNIMVTNGDFREHKSAN